MDEWKMLLINWGLLYNLSENKIRGPKNLSYIEDFPHYISFIEANILESQKDVLKDAPEIQKFHKIQNFSRQHPVCNFLVKLCIVFLYY